ncbi:hypothetical protein J6590_024261 [Homalodisca vitripennis]|nr:hypothetical protein J6590_024261 [Homalodisca vitripennis]
MKESSSVTYFYVFTRRGYNKRQDLRQSVQVPGAICLIYLGQVIVPAEIGLLVVVCSVIYFKSF